MSEQLGKALKVKREKAGVSLEDAAQWIGVSTEDIEQMEREGPKSGVYYFLLLGLYDQDTLEEEKGA